MNALASSKNAVSHPELLRGAPMPRLVHRLPLAAIGVVFAVLLSACSTTATPGVTAPTDTLGTTVQTTTAAPATTATTATTTTTVAPTTRVKPAAPKHVVPKPKPAAPKTTHAKPKKKPAPSYPAGATAVCNDGTLSYSKHRSGTCSHHGGVATWL
jgi:hypothetical protein